jgi:hypothetical protein
VSVDDLLDALVAADFGAGLTTRLRAYAVLAVAPDLGAKTLQDYLAPLYVSDPSRLGAFHALVDAWAAKKSVDVQEAAAEIDGSAFETPTHSTEPGTVPQATEETSQAKALFWTLFEGVSSRRLLFLALAFVIGFSPIVFYRPGIFSLAVWTGNTLLQRRHYDSLPSPSPVVSDLPTEDASVAAPPRDSRPGQGAGEPPVPILAKDLQTLRRDYGMAPTVAELVARGVLKGEVSAVTARTTLPAQQPLPMTDPWVLLALAAERNLDSHLARPDVLARGYDITAEGPPNYAGIAWPQGVQSRWEAARLLSRPGVDEQSNPAGALAASPERLRLKAGASGRVVRFEEGLVEVTYLDGSFQAWTLDGRWVGSQEEVARSAAFPGIFAGRSITLAADPLRRFPDLASTGLSALAMSQDGQRRVVIKNSNEAVLYVGGDPPRLLPKVRPKAAAFLPSGRDPSAPPHLLIAEANGLISLWTAAGARERAVAKVNEGIVSLASSPQGDLFAVESASGEIMIYDAATGSLEKRLSGGAPNIGSLQFSPDGRRLLAEGVYGPALVWDWRSGLIVQRVDPVISDDRSAGVVSADFSPDGKQLVVLQTDGSVRVVDAEDPLISAIQRGWQTPWTTQGLAHWLKAKHPKINIEASDAQIARAASARAFSMGQTLRLVDPPWAPRRPFDREWRNLEDALMPMILGGVLVVALFTWLRLAFRQRLYLNEAPPNEQAKVVSLFADARRASERGDPAMRAVARRLLSREAGVERFDAAASVRATARAAGVFSPVYRANSFTPEYLVLIDGGARSDHRTRRVIEFLRRLSGEKVPLKRMFFERAPDRVREDVGKSLRPLDLALAEHGHRRLILVGEAGLLMRGAEIATQGVNWIDVARQWAGRVVLTTTPSAAWGNQEAALAAALQTEVAPFSSDGLIRAEFTPEDAATGRLLYDRQATPRLRLLRGLTAPRWLSEAPPPDVDQALLIAELKRYLGYHGFRWLCACGIYPVVDWELTTGLGWMLLGRGDLAIYSDALAARLGELPWFRGGHIPGWARDRLIAALEPADLEVLRALFANVQDTLSSDHVSTANSSINLRFESDKGKAATASPSADQRFVNLVTKWPRDRQDRSALEVTRRLRALLRPPIWRRLFLPMQAPRFWASVIYCLALVALAVGLSDHMLSNGSLLGFAILALGPLAPSATRSAWSDLRASIRVVHRAVAQRSVWRQICFFGLTVLGFVSAAYELAVPQVGLDVPNPSGKAWPQALDPGPLLRWRLVVWVTCACLGPILALLIYLLADFDGLRTHLTDLVAVALDISAQSSDDPWIANLVVRTIVLAGLATLAWTAWRTLKFGALTGARWAERAAADRAALRRFAEPSLRHVIIGVLFAVPVWALLAMCLFFLYAIFGMIVMAVCKPALEGKPLNDFLAALLVIAGFTTPMLISAWHALTLRRMARRMQWRALNLSKRVRTVVLSPPHSKLARRAARQLRYAGLGVRWAPTFGGRASRLIRLPLIEFDTPTPVTAAWPAARRFAGPEIFDANAVDPTTRVADLVRGLRDVAPKQSYRPEKVGRRYSSPILPMPPIEDAPWSTPFGVACGLAGGGEFSGELTLVVGKRGGAVRLDGGETGERVLWRHGGRRWGPTTRQTCAAPLLALAPNGVDAALEGDRGVVVRTHAFEAGEDVSRIDASGDALTADHGRYLVVKAPDGLVVAKQDVSGPWRPDFRRTVPEHPAEIVAFATARAAPVVAIMEANRISLVNLEDHSEICAIDRQGPPAAFQGVMAVSPSGQRVATWDGALITVWDANGRLVLETRPSRRRGRPQQRLGLWFANEHRLLVRRATSDLEIWDVDGGVRVAHVPARSAWVAVSPSGQRLAVGWGDTIKVWRAGGRSEIWR